jgi:CRISPR-associated protein Csb2
LRLKLKNRNTAAEQKHLLARLDARILALIWKAFHQAGWTTDALSGAEVEYRSVGWFRGLDLARNYFLLPLPFPRYHLRVRFSRPIAGPLAIGAGRYRGMGLFAREDA